MIIIFSGYNQRAIIAFLRYLSLMQIDDYIIIAASDKDPILLSSYNTKVKYIRKHKVLDISELTYIIRRLNCGGESIIAPTTEALNRFLLKNRSIFEQVGCVVPLVNSNLYELISDKSSFYKICKENNFAVPETLCVGERFEKPYVAKPKKYYADNGCVYSPYLILDEADHISFLSKKIEDNFEFQEYIEGESYYLLYYIGKDGRINSYSQRNLLQQSDGKSILAAVGSCIHKEEISRKYERVLKNMGYYGMIMIELRRNGSDYYMIEANPRFWGPSQLFVDSGINLWGEFLLDLGINCRDRYKDVKQKDAVYYWEGGRNGKEVWLQGGKDIFLSREREFIQSDIYNRKDTINIYREEKVTYEKK